MRARTLGSFALTMVLGLGGAAAARGADRGLADLAREAVSPNDAEAAAAIAALRKAGPAGLEALLDASPAPQGAARERLFAAIDAVAQQRDAAFSRLYWYTDLDEARAAARATGRPILSLRLLGKLTDELSCANSRFFRTTLYANAEISQLLRERFVLHWSSERPVPRITIDFGDGRKIERTITGNSAHYVLDAEGRPVDALPGLCGPAAFRRGLERAAAIEAAARRNPSERERILRRLHRKALAVRAADWARDLAALGLARPAAAAGAQAPPSADEAGRIAVGKSAVERPILRAIGEAPLLAPGDVGDEMWTRIARLHADDARLDDASRALVERKLGLEGPALARALARFEQAVAEDGVRNEYVLHRRIDEWFAAGAAGPDLAALNERVYAELFLTPRSDPWLGLVDREAYAALDKGGCVE